MYGKLNASMLHFCWSLSSVSSFCAKTMIICIPWSAKIVIFRFCQSSGIPCGIPDLPICEVSSSLLAVIGLFAQLLFCSSANPYCIVIGLFISIFDAFPILGSGMILIPWGLVKLFHGSFFAAAVLLTAYLLTVFTRELLEARLIGSNLNTLPFFTLASIYIGISLYGVCGIFLCPFAGSCWSAPSYQIWMLQCLRAFDISELLRYNLHICRFSANYCLT